MAVAEAPYRQIIFSDFSGGLNLRDDPAEIAINESPDLFNVTINSRGGVEKRLGYSQWNTANQPAALISMGYFSQVLDLYFWQAGASLYAQSGNADLNPAIKTFTSDAMVSMVDFVGKLWVLHPVDGLFSYDGSTFSSAIAGAPAGDTLALWQNKLWSARGIRLSYCDAGDGTNWASGGAGQNDLRVVDDERITCLIPADREGLLAFKENSAYRVYDSTTAAYVTIDGSRGAAGPMCADRLYGRVYAVNTTGVYSTDGLSPLADVSDKLRPLFNQDELNFSLAPQWAMCGSPVEGKLRVSVTTLNSPANDLVLEFDPGFSAWTVQNCAFSTCVSHEGLVLGGAPTTPGQIWHLYDHVGTDYGTNIASRFQSALFKPDQLGKMRLRKALVRGRGSFTLHTKLDDNIGTNGSFPISFIQTAALWDSDYLWDDANSVWGPSVVDGIETIYSLGVCRDFSIEINETGGGVQGFPQMLDLLPSPQAGYWGLFAVKVYYVSLGLA